jgi:uncharacterized repeat protein (TIGR03943 family)
MYGVARATVIALLGLLVGWYLVSDEIYLYVQERSAWLVALSIPCLMLMAVTGFRRARAERVVTAADPVRRGDLLALVWLAVPLVIGLVIPARPLASTALELQTPARPNRASRLPETPLAWAGGALDLDTRQLASLSARDPMLQGLDGQHVSLVGFVYRTADLPEDRFRVGRFVVRCCTADAIALSFLVHYDRSSELTRDAWVSINGTVARIDGSTQMLPIVEAEQVTIVPQPSRPYLYP